eukprot:9108508-Pyramimonas_sp.AAC.1
MRRSSDAGAPAPQPRVVRQCQGGSPLGGSPASPGNRGSRMESRGVEDVLGRFFAFSGLWGAQFLEEVSRKWRFLEEVATPLVVTPLCLCTAPGLGQEGCPPYGPGAMSGALRRGSVRLE